MLREPKTIDVDPDSELSHLLDEASKAPLILARNGMRYRLSVEDDPWANYDSEAVRKAVRAIAGRWNAADAERMKEAIYRAREAGKRLANRL